MTKKMFDVDKENFFNDDKKIDFDNDKFFIFFDNDRRKTFTVTKQFFLM